MPSGEAQLLALERSSDVAAAGEPGPASTGSPGGQTDHRAVALTLAQQELAFVYHQIAVLDEAEQGETDSAALALLYSLDHAANQMRRKFEIQILLADGRVDHDSEDPENLIDVVRDAICGVRDYRRAVITAMPPGALAPGVSDDMVYLVAELLENAIAHSPADKRVEISGYAAADGSVVIYVQNDGDPVSPLRMVELNNRLGTLPALDASAAKHLGLYVVAKLALRHGAFVQLQPRPTGGVIAALVLPGNLVIDQVVPPADPAPTAPVPASGDRWAKFGEPAQPGAHLTTSAGLPKRVRQRAAPTPAIPAARLPDPGGASRGMGDLSDGLDRAAAEIRPAEREEM